MLFRSGYIKGKEESLELLELYTLPPYRGRGAAAGLLNYASEVFERKGIQSVLCNINGELEEVYEQGAFLLKNGFRPLEANWHVYYYDRDLLLETLGKWCHREQNPVPKFSKAELRWIVHNSNGLPKRIRNQICTGCDMELSRFLVCGGEICGAVLADYGGADELMITDSYIRPEWKNKKRMLELFYQVIREASSGITKVSLATENIESKILYQFLFESPMRDEWIQLYERETRGW